MPNGVPGLRMNATRRPSGDHVGLVSRSTPGAMYVTVRLLRSYTPMKLWSPRSLTNAIVELSGDQTGPPFVPHTLTSGTSPLSIGESSACALVRRTR